jgi:hypothetical protein
MLQTTVVCVQLCRKSSTIGFHHIVTDIVRENEHSKYRLPPQNNGLRYVRFPMNFKIGAMHFEIGEDFFGNGRDIIGKRINEKIQAMVRENSSIHPKVT